MIGAWSFGVFWDSLAFVEVRETNPSRFFFFMARKDERGTMVKGAGELAIWWARQCERRPTIYFETWQRRRGRDLWCFHFLWCSSRWDSIWMACCNARMSVNPISSSKCEEVQIYQPVSPSARNGAIVYKQILQAWRQQCILVLVLCDLNARCGSWASKVWPSHPPRAAHPNLESRSLEVPYFIVPHQLMSRIKW